MRWAYRQLSKGRGKDKEKEADISDDEDLPQPDDLPDLDALGSLFPLLGKTTALPLVPAIPTTESVMQNAASSWQFSFVELWVLSNDERRLVFDADACVINENAVNYKALVVFKNISKMFSFEKGV